MLNKIRFEMISGILALLFVASLLTMPLLGASSSNSNVNANVVVSSACFIGLSTNTITFGNMAPTSTYDTNVLVTDSDSGGNIASNILIEGANWISGSNNFGISNTLWSQTSQSTYTGTALSTGLVDTNIEIPAPTTSNPATSNNIYFGLSVPGGTPAGVYQQVITFENSC